MRWWVRYVRVAQKVAEKGVVHIARINTEKQSAHY
jgi:hypothetical protein